MVASSISSKQGVKTTSNNIALDDVISRAQTQILDQQHVDGYWWYSLEANDSINAEYIFLLHYLGLEDAETVQGLCRWMLNSQNNDGSWSLYHGGPGDMSSTVECYIALKMSGYDVDCTALMKAKEFIRRNGGLTKIRVFSRVHLALLGLVDWKICPNMPVAMIQFPEWSPINIYEFSSWARACIVPLLVIQDKKLTKPIPNFNIDELYVEENLKQAKWEYDQTKFLSLDNIFVKIDMGLQIFNKLELKPFRRASLKKCEKYITEHLDETEDIFPAMNYGIIALVSLGYTLEDEVVLKALKGLKSFHLKFKSQDIPELSFDKPLKNKDNLKNKAVANDNAMNACEMMYQQCCISPVWDTAWAGVALARSGVKPNHDKLLQTAHWLLSKQITDVVGDWGKKNPGVKPGGWSFEFNNKHYPDLDDTIEVLTFLHAVDVPYRLLKAPFERGLNWLLSMQCKNGGFAAFDKDNDLEILNKIPFSDHGACLDPATVDISGRVIEFLITTCEFENRAPIIQRAANFIKKNQEKNGSFWGRWGVNYLYGTWCALEGLCVLNRNEDKLVITRALKWLKSTQNEDGGFGESCQSYAENKYVKDTSSASQTSWALMGLIAAGEANSDEATKAAAYLTQTQNSQGGWDEAHFTGTGFPGHFYIRYHGYRYYFPLLALAKYQAAL
jgi:squalene-hopene/tetraprenyl-beta-curcumene cyclase